MKTFSSTTKVNSRRSLRNFRIKLVLILAIVSLLLFYFTPTFLKLSISLVSYPALVAKSWVLESPSFVAVFLRDRASVYEEINSLQSDLLVANTNEDTIAYLSNELESLRSFAQGFRDPFILGTVSLRPPLAPYDALVIDVGSDNGVTEGAPVYIRPYHAIGIVAAVYEKSSTVALFTTPNFETTAYIFGPNIFVTAKGQGGGVLSLGVPQGVALAEGDMVSLPAFGEGLIGSVSNIRSIATEPEQSAFVTIPFSLEHIRYVFVGGSPVKSPEIKEIEESLERARQQLIPLKISSELITNDLINASSTEATE